MWRGTVEEHSFAVDSASNQNRQRFCKNFIEILKGPENKRDRSILHFTFSFYLSVSCRQFAKYVYTFCRKI